MSIVRELYREHQEMKNDVKLLPEIGQIIEISQKETDNRGGNSSRNTYTVRVEEKFRKNGLILTKHLKTNVRECFTNYDFLHSKSIQWKEVE
jgi:hypothetical protein